MDKHTLLVAIFTGLGTFIATVFGKPGWNFLVRRYEIKSEVSCLEKIRLMEIEIAKERLKTSQIVTGVDMMLTMLEDEFAEGDAKYIGVINKVREYIKPSENE